MRRTRRRIPTVKQIREEFIHAGDDEEISTRADTGNFTKALRDAGFERIIPSASCKGV